ncbi:MAG: histidine phosphatase family protein [Bacteroidales bacterium]|nr:histidine phosphatase family protein [Bacteroidales bacterium]
MILEKPSRSGGCLHAYEPLDTLFSSTPDGYEPFYISHFGRHGSRYAGSKEDFSVIDELMKYSSRNYAGARKSSADSPSTSISGAESRKVTLSETGEQLLSDLIALKEYSEGKYGQLTEKGAREHRNISRRMCSHYPQVFSNPERKRVIAVSTTSGRTIASKENFLAQLALNAPDLEVSSYTARDTLKYPVAVLATSGYPMSKEVRRNERFPDTSESTARLMKGFDSRRLRSLLFVSNCNDSIDDSIFIRIQFSGRHYECIGDTLVPNFEKYFTAEELYYLWTVETLIWYAHSCACEGADHTRMHYYGAGILRTIIDEADSAIAGNSVAANLRFSHDTYLYPLLALMGVEGADYQGPAIGALDRVIDFTNVCTAGNVQLIFYKKQAAQANQPDVLVKILKNEKEVLIPSLAPSTGCYYDWQDLKNYFIQRITMF